MFVSELDKFFSTLKETADELTHCPKTLKSFARAFEKARRVEGRSPSWVLRAKPLTLNIPIC